MDNFEGKNILIVGASSGIGHSLLKSLKNTEANLFSASRRQPEGDQFKHIQLDITKFSPSDLASLPDTIHGLVYCPGSITLKPFNRLSEQDLQNDFEVNILGAFRVIQAILPQLKKAKGASIVLFSTVAVQVGMNYHTSISAAKGAVEGMAKSLAAELANSKIRVNTIAPSLTDTPLAEKLLATEEKKEASAKRHPLKRVGSPSDMASMAQFLLSDAASWMTGQIIGIDGGMSALRPL